MKRVSSEEKDKLLNLYNSGKSVYKIADEMQIDNTTVYYHLYKLGVKLKDRRKYNLNENFFETVDTEEKAYFLGFVASDGCVTDENKMLISLQKRDSYILDVFKKVLFYEGIIYNLKPRKNCHQEQRRLQFKSEKMCKDLNKLGIFPRKSLILKFPTEEQVPNHLIHHFIRGYFDGDGCLKIAKGVLCYKIVGTFEFLDKLQDILIDKCNLKKTKMYQANKDKNTFELSYGGDRQCIRIYGYLYKNASPKLFLERKKEKARIEISDSLNYYPSEVLFEELQNRNFKFVS